MTQQVILVGISLGVLIQEVIQLI